MGVAVFAHPRQKKRIIGSAAFPQKFAVNKVSYFNTASVNFQGEFFIKKAIKALQSGRNALEISLDSRIARRVSKYRNNTRVCAETHLYL